MTIVCVTESHTNTVTLRVFAAITSYLLPDNHLIVPSLYSIKYIIPLDEKHKALNNVQSKTH